MRRVGSSMMSVVILALLLWALPTAAGQSWRRLEFAQRHMGVPFRIILHTTDPESADLAAREVFARIRSLDKAFSDYDQESEVRRLCALAKVGDPMSVGPDLYELLTRSVAMSQLSNGAFDVTVGPLVSLWRQARHSGTLPSPKELQRARAAVGWKHLQLAPKGRQVTFDRPHMALDFGGIAKGYAVDASLEVLRRRGLSRAMVDGGGDLALGDPPPGRRGWRIAVAPLEPDEEPHQALSLSNMAVATSGDAFQHVTIEGKRYSHIVDPATGLGLSHRSSVTVVAREGLTADALASAVSVLGPKGGLALVEKTPEAACCIVQVVGGRPEVHTSSRWGRFIPR